MFLVQNSMRSPQNHIYSVVLCSRESLQTSGNDNPKRRNNCHASLVAQCRVCFPGIAIHILVFLYLYLPHSWNRLPPGRCPCCLPCLAGPKSCQSLSRRWQFSSVFKWKGLWGEKWILHIQPCQHCFFDFIGSSINSSIVASLFFVSVMGSESSGGGLSSSSWISVMVRLNSLLFSSFKACLQWE